MSARRTHLDAETGSTTAGRRDDFVILDRDLRTAGTPIDEASVVATFISGERV
jgi:hypothetical protein